MADFQVSTEAYLDLDCFYPSTRYAVVLLLKPLQDQSADFSPVLHGLHLASRHARSPTSDAVLAQFNRLMHELLGGNTQRNTFRPWEIEILLDIERCNVSGSNQGETALRRYQEAVQRHMEKGARLPLKFSEYQKVLMAKRNQRDG